MTFEAAQRATEILLALALFQRSVEHLAGPRAGRALFAVRAGLCIGLAIGVATIWILGGLILCAQVILHRFGGPYNGGSDRMGLLILLCLFGSHLAPTEAAGHLALGYLALQLVMSYFISGGVKIVNRDWRTGQALRDVFAFSAYPVSTKIRSFAQRPALLCAMSWAVMLFELLFPLALLHPTGLAAALAVAATFHLANAVLFGLNRFFWVWLAAFPSLWWFQGRFIAPL